MSTSLITTPQAEMARKNRDYLDLLKKENRFFKEGAAAILAISQGASFAAWKSVSKKTFAVTYYGGTVYYLDRNEGLEQQIQKSLLIHNRRFCKKLSQWGCLNNGSPVRQEIGYYVTPCSEGYWVIFKDESVLVNTKENLAFRINEIILFNKIWDRFYGNIYWSFFNTSQMPLLVNNYPEFIEKNERVVIFKDITSRSIHIRIKNREIKIYQINSLNQDAVCKEVITLIRGAST